MIKLEIKTKLSKDEALNQLKSFFGKGGLGLNLDEESPECLNFSGGCGYVNVVICPEKKKTRIELLSQEYEHDVEAFAGSMS